MARTDSYHASRFFFAFSEIKDTVLLRLSEVFHTFVIVIIKEHSTLTIMKHTTGILEALQIGQIVITTGGNITQGGLIGIVIERTPCTVTIEVKELFFPIIMHPTWGKHQVGKDRRDFLSDGIKGQKRKFWVKGSRQGFEHGSANEWAARRIMDDVSNIMKGESPASIKAMLEIDDFKGVEFGKKS